MKTGSSTASCTKTAASPSKKLGKSTEHGTSPQASDVTLWIKALSLNHEIDKPGPEWKSSEQLQQMLNCSHVSAKRYATKAVKRGTLEKKMFTCLRSNGSRIKRPFYKLV